MSGNTVVDDYLKYYWGIIHRKRYLAIAIAMAILSLFAWGGLFMPKKYEASATVFIERNSLITPMLQGVGVTVSLEERVRNLRNILTSRTLLERVIKKLNLDAQVKNPTQLEGLIDGLRRSVIVNVRSGGERSSDLLFSVSYRGNDPKKVVDLVNAHVQECIAISMSSREMDVAGAYEFIEKELQGYKVKLELADKAIREFREQHPQMVPQTESSVVNRIENFRTGHIDAEIKLRELEKRRESLKKQISGEKELTVAFVTREGSPQARLNYLNGQLMLLLTKYTDSYPEVIKIKNEIEELQKQIDQATEQQRTDSGSARSETAAMNPVYQQLKEELARTDVEIETLRARQTELERQQQEGQRILRSMPKEQEEWSKLQRDRNVFQTIYDNLLHKLESARVSRDLEMGEKNTTFRVVDPPILPQLPTSPNRFLLIIIGLVLGVVAGTGSVIGLDYLNPSFKGESKLESELKIPFLVSVPEIVSEREVTAAAVLDAKVYKAAGIYLAIIGLMLFEAFLYRFLGISLVKW